MGKSALILFGELLIQTWELELALDRESLDAESRRRLRRELMIVPNVLERARFIYIKAVRNASETEN